MEKIWKCKIGGEVGDLPAGADGPMRRAVQIAFETLTGVEASFTFSGWGATLTEVERAVHENRDPNCGAMQEAIDAGDGTLHGAIEYWHEEALRLRAELALAIDDCRAAQVERDNVRAAYITQIDRLRAELAESKKEIALLKTPNLVWDFDDPENSAVDSVADAVYQHIDWWGDINVGDVMTFLTARKLSNVTIRITSVNDDGEVTFEAIDAAMAGGE